VLSLKQKVINHSLLLFFFVFGNIQAPVQLSSSELHPFARNTQTISDFLIRFLIPDFAVYVVEIGLDIDF